MEEIGFEVKTEDEKQWKEKNKREEFEKGKIFQNVLFKIQ